MLAQAGLGEAAGGLMAIFAIVGLLAALLLIAMISFGIFLFCVRRWNRSRDP